MSGATAVLKKSSLYPIREPSGRLSRASEIAVEALAPAAVRRLRDEAARKVRDPMFSTELGRYFLDGKFTAAEYEAGKRWANLVVAYYQAIDARPPHPKAAALFVADPSAEPDPESEEGKKRHKDALRIVADMKAAHARLKAFGDVAEKAVRNLCEEDRLPWSWEQFDRIKAGLKGLAIHWGLTKA